MKILLNWLLFLMLTGFIVAVIWYRQLIGLHLPSLPVRGTMTGIQVILFALSLAFTWVEVLKWWKNIKPFNCIKCMCGWFALILAIAFHVEFWYMYLPAGLFVGALFGAIKMRWL